MKDKFTDLLEGYYKFGDYLTVFESLLGRINEEKLQYATKALVLGAGPGIREVKFLNKLAPKLESTTFVEPNVDCFEELRRNLSSSFGNSVETKLFNCKMEEWQSNDEKFDVILMLHCLYGVEEQTRRDVLRRCVEQWLTPGGLLYISMVDDQHDEGKETDMICKVYKELGLGRMIDINDIKTDVVSIGKQVYKEYPYVKKQDINSFSKDFVGFLRYYCTPETTDEQIYAAIEAVKKRGFRGVTKEILCAIRNA